MDMEQPLETLRRKAGQKVQIALRARRENTIVAIGMFPENCPQEAISHWIHKKNQEYLLIA